MLKRLFAGACALSLAALAGACGGGADHTTTNANHASANSNATAAANANAAGAEAGTRTAPDNSEIRTEKAAGVTTQTRTFRDPNSRVERVVVTTRDGKRTALVYYRDRTARELPETQIEQALGMTAEALYNAGGKVVDASKGVAGAVADKVEDVPSEADDAARAAGRGAKEVGDKAEDVGGAAVSGAKKAGKATAKGAKKVGGAVKDAVTP